ncbi:MAG: ELWxxDGT repeat protein [Bacteroidota bacterium]
MKRNICFYILMLFSSQLLMAQTSMVSQLYLFSYLDNLNGKLMFFAADTVNPGDYELYTSDGTTGGTHRVKDINPGPAAGVLDGSLWAAPFHGNTPVIFNNKIYFLASDGIHGLEVWSSDGTDAGTTMLKDIYPGADGFTTPNLRYPYFCELNGILYFAANDGSHGFELWKTDGTTAGTVMVKDIAADAIYGSMPTELVNFNGSLYFSARDDNAGVEVFKSDGTANGTQVLKDVIPGLQGATNDGYQESLQTHFKVSGNYLYFLARIDSTLPVITYLYRTDGTANGTIALDNSLENVSELTDFNGTLFFFSNDGVTLNSNIYKSDGTPSGTVYVPTNNTMRATLNYFVHNGSLYFSGDQNNFTQFGLFKSDGTAAGTSLIYSLTGLSSIPEVTSFIGAGNSVFCRALTAVSANQMDNRILQSNGTTNGSHLYSGTSPFRASTVMNGNFYFSGHDTSNTSVWGLYKIVPVIASTDMILPENAVTLFPNPNSGSFTLQMNELENKKVKISFFNVFGQSVLENTYEDFQDIFSRQINLENCAPGIYLMTAESEGKKITKKFVIENH